MDQQEIVPADKRFRRRVLWWGGVLVAGCAVGVALMHRHFDAILEVADRDIDQAVRKARQLGALFAWLCGLSLVGIGIWFGHLGWKIYLADRYPPPRMKVIRDTLIRTGKQARRIANMALVACGVLVVLGLASGWLLHRLAAAVLK